MAPGRTGAPYVTTSAPVSLIAPGVRSSGVYTHSSAADHHIGTLVYKAQNI